MNYKPLDIGLILLPSIRSHAYCYTFKQLGVYPKDVILMQGNPGNFSELRKEDERYNYSASYFNLISPDDTEGFDPYNFLKVCNANVMEVPTSDINNEFVLDRLSKSSCEYFLFTGGGIVKKETLCHNKKLIHIHPGIVPEYRGSTCFYYSLLETNKLGSTAIIMDENIDTGDVIASTVFSINYTIHPDQPLFMDYILDPYIRSYTLKKVLEKYISEAKIRTCRQVSGTKPAYFVIHPFLRHLAIDKINSFFCPNDPIGIFEIN